MAKKQGYEKGLGKYSVEVKLDEGKGDDPSAKGKELTEVYTNDDLGAVRRPSRV